MRESHFCELLELNGIRPTPNRLLVVDSLSRSKTPMSLLELETALDTLDRSSISRVLNLLSSRSLVHTLEDGRGISKYELCHGSHSHEGLDSDVHPHFYCEVCNKVTCLDCLEIPSLHLPESYKVHSVNYMIKGICPNCSKNV
ncbi:MAG: transcriptional repressor [Muribaculaceae bacterium]|nr:transcriptional repressor [Muribaculaceae bacterium]